MKLMQVLLCFAAMIMATAASACSSLPVHAKPINKLEARSLPADVVTQRTLGQLADILQLTAVKRDQPPVNVLEFLSFELPARLTDEPGLCRKDLLFVTFGHETQDNPDSATPTRANGVESWSEFSFLAGAADDEACRSLVDDAFFYADSEYDARNAAPVLAKATEQIRGGRPEFEISCPFDKPECLTFLGAFDLQNVRSVRACDQIGDPGDCWSYSYSESGEVEIKTDYDKGQKTILSVKVVERYVHINERVD